MNIWTKQTHLIFKLISIGFTLATPFFSIIIRLLYLLFCRSLSRRSTTSAAAWSPPRRSTTSRPTSCSRTCSLYKPDWTRSSPPPGGRRRRGECWCRRSRSRTGGWPRSSGRGKALFNCRKVLVRNFFFVKKHVFCLTLSMPIGQWLWGYFFGWGSILITFLLTGGGGNIIIQWDASFCTTSPTPQKKCCKTLICHFFRGTSFIVVSDPQVPAGGVPVRWA